MKSDEASCAHEAALKESAQRARRYLERVRTLDEEIGLLLTQIRSVRERAERGLAPAQDEAHVRAGYFGSRVEDGAVLAADLTEVVRERIAELARLKKECAALIARLPAPDIRAMLQLRYLLLYPWDRIVDELHFDVRNAYRLHNRGLRMVGLILDEEEYATE